MSQCPGITEEQLKTTNGCGSSAWYAWIFRIPKWFSHDFWCYCNTHDIIYQDPALRSLVFKFRADDALINAMYDSAFLGSIWLRYPRYLIATLTWYALSTKVSEWCWYRAKRGQR